MAPTAIPRFVLLKRFEYPHSFFAYYDEVDNVPGSVAAESEIGAFNPMAKIEVEKAKIGSKYIHLRFSHNNKYWSRNNADDNFIVAVSTKPVEDKSDPSCTLFEANETIDNTGIFRLTQVQSQLLVEIRRPHSRAMLVSRENTSHNRLRFVDSETIVKLPKHLALKALNGKFLQGADDDNSSLAFTSDDPNDPGSGHEIHLTPSGQVRIKSDHFGRFWKCCEGNWVRAVSSEEEIYDNDTLFWPVKIDGNTVALRSPGKKKFCRPSLRNNDPDYLKVAVENMTKEARLELQELVSMRKIYNVRYRMDEARIYDEVPYMAGSTRVQNETEEKMSVSTAMKFEEETSYAFSRSERFSACVNVNIETNLLKIVEGVRVEMCDSIDEMLEWETRKTMKETLETVATAVVPPKSWVKVNYIAKKGNFSVPFAYTQRDTSSTTGESTENEQVDGIYTGLSCYGFQFTVEEPQPLLAFNLTFH